MTTTKIQAVYPCPRCRCAWDTIKNAENCVTSHEASEKAIDEERAKHHRVQYGEEVFTWTVRCRSCSKDFPVKATTGRHRVPPPDTDTEHKCPHCAESALIYDEGDWLAVSLSLIHI